MTSNGAPGVGTATNALQNPVTSENDPPLICPASCWPIVPLTLNCPPLLVPPPPAILDQSMEKSAALPMVLIPKTQSAMAIFVFIRFRNEVSRVEIIFCPIRRACVQSSSIVPPARRFLRAEFHCATEAPAALQSSRLRIRGTSRACSHRSPCPPNQEKLFPRPAR